MTANRDAIGPGNRVGEKFVEVDSVKRVLIRVCLLVVLVTACSSGGENQEEPSTTTTESGTTSSTSSSPTSVPRPTVVPEPQDDLPRGVFVPDEVVDAALEQAATDTGMSPDDFEVDRAMQVTWNDGSLGCPEEGRSYIQALTDGYWVVLTRAGDTYDYRSSLDAEFRMCADGAPPVSVYEDR